MNKAVLILLAVAITCVTACSKTEPQAKAPEAKLVASDAAAQPLDYKKICEHLVPLAPESRKASFTLECVASYQSYLPACRNAAAVNDCFVNLKSWAGRLACLDSCVRDPEPGK